jgi:hypothetical protein
MKRERAGTKSGNIFAVDKNPVDVHQIFAAGRTIVFQRPRLMVI